MVLRNLTFRSHVALVVVDELHLVHDWEKFCKSYAQLFKESHLDQVRPSVVLLLGPDFEIDYSAGGKNVA